MREPKLLGRFGVILADPPWSYTRAGPKGLAEDHYTTMSMADIGALPISELSEDDCVLALWTTGPHIEKTVDIIRRWGFEYVTMFPWIKTVASSGTVCLGVGLWVRGAAEYMFICRKGSPVRSKGVTAPCGLVVGDEPVFYSPRRKHSEKPLGIHEWIEGIFPYSRKLELFARVERDGWTCIGHEIGSEILPVADNDPNSLWPETG